MNCDVAVIGGAAEKGVRTLFPESKSGEEKGPDPFFKGHDPLHRGS
jgi:hypothetical protein